VHFTWAPITSAIWRWCAPISRPDSTTWSCQNAGPVSDGFIDVFGEQLREFVMPAAHPA